MADDTPVSPAVSSPPPHTFPHNTTNTPSLHAFLDTSIKAINESAPAELDSTPVPPDAEGSGRPRRKSGVNPDHDSDVYEHLSGEKGVGAREVSSTCRGTSTKLITTQKREALLEERSRDPAVMVDPPEGPSADEIRESREYAGKGWRQKQST